MESKVDLLTREQKFRLLDQLVSNGIEELCRFAKQHKFLEPPYGKRPDPTPLISEEDFVQAGALQCDDKEPEFQYEYGFDPVKFLGQYLVWAHPDSVETRRLKKVDALSRLRFRVAHARRQLHTEQILRERAQNFSSGVAWGPLALLVTATSVRLSLRTFRAATVLVQVAADAAFSDDVRYLRLAAAETQPGVFLAKADLDKLRSKQLYHVRAFAAGEGDAAALPADADFWLATEADALCRLALYASFSTAPVETDAGDGAAQAADDGDEDEPRPKTQRPASRSASREVDDATELAAMREKLMTLRCIGQLPLEAALFAPPALPAPQLSRGLQPPAATEAAAGGDDDASVASFADSRARAPKAERPPDATALLGDVFWHRDADLFEAPLPPEQYAAQLSALLQRLFYALATAPPAATPDAPASTSLLLAYRDAHPRAMAALRQEELAFKQHRHDVKKFNKKHDLADDGKARGARGKAAKAAASGAKAAETKDLPPPPLLRLPELSPSLQVLLQQLPVPLSMQPPPAAPPKDEKPKPPKRPGAPPAAPPAPVPEPLPLAPRMLYRAVQLCADVLVITLDLRRTPPHLTTQAPFFAPACDYLGREQADWLARILRKSTALWKVILCAKAFGVARVREVVATQTTQSSLQFGGSGGDDGRPGTASPPPLLSRPLTADGAAADGAAPAVPGAGGLKRQASANASSQTRFVQVLEPEKDESRSLDAVYDDVDDAFRRPKCSLQYVLARYQEKLVEEAAKELNGAPPPQVLPPPLRPETDGAGRVEQLYVSSGVVLVTGGVASAFTRHVTTTLRAAPSSAASRPASPEAAVSNSSSAQTLLSTASGAAVSVTVADVGETPAPGFCATYASLTSTATQAAGSPLDARAPPQALPFCAEVSLGQAAPDGFSFLQGFDARAAFVHDAPGEARDVVAAPQCELSLLADGRLEIACFESLPLQTHAAEAAPPSGSDTAGRRALFTCRLTVPSLDGDDAASTQSADSVHVA